MRAKKKDGKEAKEKRTSLQFDSKADSISPPFFLPRKKSRILNGPLEYGKRLEGVRRRLVFAPTLSPLMHSTARGGRRGENRRGRQESRAGKWLVGVRRRKEFDSCKVNPFPSLA